MAVFQEHDGETALPRWRACWFLLIAMAFSCIACGNGDEQLHPDGNKIGRRHAGFMKLIAHARTLPEGRFSNAELPEHLRISNLTTLYVDPGKAYALRFPSRPIDTDPVFVYVEEDQPDPEGIARATCQNRPWHFGRKLDERGWYYMIGP